MSGFSEWKRNENRLEAGVRCWHRNQVRYDPMVIGLRWIPYNFADLFLCQYLNVLDKYLCKQHQLDNIYSEMQKNGYWRSSDLYQAESARHWVQDAWRFITKGQHAPQFPMTITILIETLCFLPLMTTSSSTGILTYNMPLGFKSTSKRAI